MSKQKRVALYSAIFALIVALILVVPAGADGFFQRCNYLNDCETFDTEFAVTNYKKGILIEGQVPDADLHETGNPLEIIVTTGDVYTKCHNTLGLKEVTGEILYRGEVQPGWFSLYVPLAEGDYNITVYMGQTECANCPQAWVVPITVKHKPCDWIYVLEGSLYDCWLLRNSKLGDGRANLPARYDGTDYMIGLCSLKNCDGSLRLIFEWTGGWTTSCEQPKPCTACP